MNPNARAHELIGLSQSLIQVMATEIETLKSGKVGDIEPLQAQKLALTGAYETHLRGVSDDPGMFNAIEPEVRAELAAVTSQFEATANENKNVVQAALEMNGRLVQVIADAVVKGTPMAAGYTKTGAAPDRQNGSTARPSPASLNRSL